MFNPSLRCSAFSGTHRIASGELRHVAMKAKQAFDASPERPVLVFDDADARTLELPLELPAADLLAWLSRPQPQVGVARGGAEDSLVPAQGEEDPAQLARARLAQGRCDDCFHRAHRGSA